MEVEVGSTIDVGAQIGAIDALFENDEPVMNESQNEAPVQAVDHTWNKTYGFGGASSHVDYVAMQKEENHDVNATKPTWKEYGAMLVADEDPPLAPVSSAPNLNAIANEIDPKDPPAKRQKIADVVDSSSTLAPVDDVGDSSLDDVLDGENDDDVKTTNDNVDEDEDETAASSTPLIADNGETQAVSQIQNHNYNLGQDQDHHEKEKGEENADEDEDQNPAIQELREENDRLLRDHARRAPLLRPEPKSVSRRNPQSLVEKLRAKKREREEKAKQIQMQMSSSAPAVSALTSSSPVADMEIGIDLEMESEERSPDLPDNVDIEDGDDALSKSMLREGQESLQLRRQLRANTLKRAVVKKTRERRDERQRLADAQRFDEDETISDGEGGSEGEGNGENVEEGQEQEQEQATTEPEVEVNPEEAEAIAWRNKLLEKEKEKVRVMNSSAKVALDDLLEDVDFDIDGDDLEEAEVVIGAIDDEDEEEEDVEGEVDAEGEGDDGMNDEGKFVVEDEDEKEEDSQTSSIPLPIPSMPLSQSQAKAKATIMVRRPMENTLDAWTQPGVTLNPELPVPLKRAERSAEYSQSLELLLDSGSESESGEEEEKEEKLVTVMKEKEKEKLPPSRAAGLILNEADEEDDDGNIKVREVDSEEEDALEFIEREEVTKYRDVIIEGDHPDADADIDHTFNQMWNDAEDKQQERNILKGLKGGWRKGGAGGDGSDSDEDAPMERAKRAREVRRRYGRRKRRIQEAFRRSSGAYRTENATGLMAEIVNGSMEEGHVGEGGGEEEGVRSSQVAPGVKRLKARAKASQSQSLSPPLSLSRSQSQGRVSMDVDGNGDFGATMSMDDVGEGEGEVVEDEYDEDGIDQSQPMEAEAVAVDVAVAVPDVGSLLDDNDAEFSAIMGAVAPTPTDDAAREGADAVNQRDRGGGGGMQSPPLLARSVSSSSLLMGRPISSGLRLGRVKSNAPVSASSGGKNGFVFQFGSPVTSPSQRRPASTVPVPARVVSTPVMNQSQSGNGSSSSSARNTTAIASSHSMLSLTLGQPLRPLASSNVY